MVGTKYNMSKKPTILNNMFGDSAQVYPNGLVILMSSIGTPDQRKFGSRPAAIRNFLGGPGGWRVIEM